MVWMAYLFIYYSLSQRISPAHLIMCFRDTLELWHFSQHFLHTRGVKLKMKHSESQYITVESSGRICRISTSLCITPSRYNKKMFA